MTAPHARRPVMPGYGTLPAGQGTGLLPWSWAAERLTRSHDYWLATVRPDGSPHLMAIWGVWHDDAVWFSTSRGSRKARNLAADPRCTVATDDAQEPVVLDGRAERVTDPTALGAFLDALTEKYAISLGADFIDPNRNATLRVPPQRVFGLTESDFTGSPTVWEWP